MKKCRKNNQTEIGSYRPMLQILKKIIFIIFLTERSRQSARECRARKKLRYQYLEELVTDREKAVVELRRELETYQQWVAELDTGNVPEGLQAMLEEIGALKQE